MKPCENCKDKETCAIPCRELLIYKDESPEINLLRKQLTEAEERVLEADKRQNRLNGEYIEAVHDLVAKHEAEVLLLNRKMEIVKQSLWKIIRGSNELPYQTAETALKDVEACK